MLLLKAFAHYLPDNVQVCVNDEKVRTCPCVPSSPKEKRYDQLIRSAWYEVQWSRGGRAKPLGVKGT